MFAKIVFVCMLSVSMVSCKTSSNGSSLESQRSRQGSVGDACGSGGIAGGHLPECASGLECVKQGSSGNAGGVCTKVGKAGDACGRGGIAGGNLPDCGSGLECIKQGSSANSGGVCTET